MPDYVRYSDGVEAPAEGELDTIGTIVLTMKAEMDKVADREGRLTRASHARSTGLLKGELRVLDGLPPALRQGVPD